MNAIFYTKFIGAFLINYTLKFVVVFLVWASARPFKRSTLESNYPKIPWETLFLLSNNDKQPGEPYVGWLLTAYKII